MSRRAVIGIAIGCLVASVAILLLDGDERRPARPITAPAREANDVRIINPKIRADEKESTSGLVKTLSRSGTLADGSRWTYRHERLADNLPESGANGTAIELDQATSDQGATVRIRTTAPVTAATLQAGLRQILDDRGLLVIAAGRRGTYSLRSSRFVARGITTRSGRAVVGGIFESRYCNLPKGRKGPLTTNISLQLACQTRPTPGPNAPSSPPSTPPPGI